MRERPYRIFTILIFLSVLIVGCSGLSGRFGSLEPNDAVKHTFESFQVNPGYKYYYTGPDSRPEAVIGILPEFKMDSVLWHPIDLTPKHLRSWIWGHANRKAGDLNRYGSKITGPDGREIGIWYSLRSWKQWARIEMLEEDRVSIGAPIDSQSGRPVIGRSYF